ncbi:hypothetical protein GYB57_06065 [bacterium]|nr:hypothetical protein [bacterium]
MNLNIFVQNLIAVTKVDQQNKLKRWSRVDFFSWFGALGLFEFLKISHSALDGKQTQKKDTWLYDS